MRYGRGGCVIGRVPRPQIDGDIDCNEHRQCYYRPSERFPRQHYHHPGNTCSLAALLFWVEIMLGVMLKAPPHSSRVLHLSSPPQNDIVPVPLSAKGSVFHRFLDLPPELREQVCGFYLASYFDSTAVQPFNLPKAPPLVSVSKVVRKDTLPIFYGAARFPLMSWDRREQWFLRVHPEIVNRIRKVWLFIDGTYICGPRSETSLLVDFDPVHRTCTATEYPAHRRPVEDHLLESAMYGLEPAMRVVFARRVGEDIGGREALEALLAITARYRL